MELGQTCSNGVLLHHFSELFEGNLTIAVGINLLDDLVDDLFVKILPERENLLDFVGRDGTTTIFVEHLESSLKLVVADQILFVHGSHNELRVVDFSGTIGINLGEHLVNFLVVERSSEELKVTILDFFLGELSVTIDVHSSEDLVNRLLLLLTQELGGDESVSGLLQLRVGIEVLEVGQCVQGHI